MHPLILLKSGNRMVSQSRTVVAIQVLKRRKFLFCISQKLNLNLNLVVVDRKKGSMTHHIKLKSQSGLLEK